MKRAVSFYEKFFGKEVDKFDVRFSIFEIDNFSFGLFDSKKDNEECNVGNNVVPNIEVEDIEQEYERVKQLDAKIILRITDVNGYRLFQFADSEGNIVEVYRKGRDFG